MKKFFKWVLRKIPRPLLIRLSYVARPVLALWLKGNKYTDPIDGKSFRTFLPYGHESPRENVLSPSTLSLERHRLLWLYLKGETTFFTDSLSVLHFAPEQAFYKRFRKLSNLKYTTTSAIFHLKPTSLTSSCATMSWSTFRKTAKPSPSYLG